MLARGQARFTTILPGCYPGRYPGRYPHMHFEAYASLDKAASYRNRILTSQLAMSANVCRTVYDGLPTYRASIRNYARSPIKRDNVFADNTAKQLAA